MSIGTREERRWSICCAERSIAVRDQKLRQVLRILETQNVLFRQQLASISTTSQLLPSGEELFFRPYLDNDMGHLDFL